MVNAAQFSGDIRWLPSVYNIFLNGELPYICIFVMNKDIGKLKKNNKTMGTMYICIQTFEQHCAVTTLFTVVNNIAQYC